MDAVAAEIQPVAMRHLGAALGHIHGLPTDSGRGTFQRYREERVFNSADLERSPTRRGRGNARSPHQLADGPPHRTRWSACTATHANNVLFHADEVHLIDFDQGGSGAAAADLGSTLGNAAGDAAAAPQGVDGWGGVHRRYSAVRQLPSNAELRWYTAAALVAERAIRAVNRVNQPVLAVLPELIEMADAVLAGKLSADG